MNEVQLQGRIFSIWEGRNVAIVKLFIEQRLPNKETKVNFPEVLFNRSDWSLLEDFSEGDFVHISGTIKTRTIINRETQRPLYQQFIRGGLISHVKNEMSEKFGCDLGGNFEYINESLIEGIITEINNRNGVINMLVKPDGERFNVSITDFAVNKDLFMSRFTVGSKVCIKSEIQTSRKEKEDGVRFYQNVVVSYMDKKREPRITSE